MLAHFPSMCSPPPNPHVTWSPFPEFLYCRRPVSLALHPSPSRERLHWEIRSSQQEGTPFPTTRHLPPSVPSPLAYGGRALPPLVPWTPPPGDQTPLSCVVIFSHSVGSRPSLNSPALALPAFASAPPFPAAFPARTS